MPMLTCAPPHAADTLDQVFSYLAESSDAAPLPAPSAALVDHARKRKRRSTQADLLERRRHPRWYGAIEVLARPADADGQPLGPAFRAVLADLSFSGIAVLHSEPVTAPTLLVQVPGRPGGKRLRLRVDRCTADGAFHLIAGPHAADA